MTPRLLATVLLFLGATAASAAPLPKDAVFVEAFAETAFGSEIPGLFGGGAYLKRFAGPIRFAVEDGASQPRRREAEGFLRRLARDLPGPGARLARGREAANFTVHIVDSKDYQAVGRRIYGNPFLRVPGACIVRSSFGRGGIRRSDALIVSDMGDELFRRCLSEEVVQGLGLLEDTDRLPDSVLNGASAAEQPMRSDRILLEMLYDPRLSPGMSLDDARPLLGEIVEDARRKTR
ncbi:MULTISPECIES: DUF2927 domain-containing protein [unclassified Aureimonas]|uniref:DUF2927 domain-containing protein n=1 Tax=unclassified Aureimonas TaxID=2615206 RepID=UPI0006FC33F1|nr:MULTISPECIES: DUF2927 domain-containing protein [unclassified Aureimonas]KQT69754.1 hypothetical protein ASG62_01145 [Aureimonas sp. Leaf427]KQT76094.1 hypothetical protein ASG54_15075 [Aureimonas sp. Leaf460]